ncbi:hypothetical protein PROFUN_16408 [Planoprotostelium fungivorum]|uniref:Uncharacterized protein n=1 Tax=Planoprotostelium fungivorum TaxID=1890364 RepID=A0A2P6MQQ8_9EUKA|nr:hypothetical protein PROFUN_16408 [Planoprotostelium fungivorum]
MIWGFWLVSVVYGHHIRTKQFNESLFIKNDFKPKKAKAQQCPCIWINNFLSCIFQ